MGLSVGELFVNLGIKGSEKTIGAIGSAQSGMKGLGSASLETKAAIVGAFYALEQLIATSVRFGSSMVNFEAFTGNSAQALQRWQYAARQVGVAGDEITGSLKGVQAAMARMLLGEGAPKGLGLIAAATKEFDVNRVRDTFYVMDQLQKAAQKLPKDLGNEALKSFGLSEATIAAMRRNAFNPKALSQAPVLSDRELGLLDKMNAQWANLGQRIELAFSRFNVKHGGELIRDISDITTSVINLANALTTLSERLGVFKVIGHAAEGIANTIRLAVELLDKFNGKESKKGDLLYSEPGKGAIPGFAESIVGKFIGNAVDLAKGILTNPQPINPVTLPMPAYPNQPGGSTQQNNVTINQNFHSPGEDTDYRRAGLETKKAVQDAFRQFSAQGQAS